MNGWFRDATGRWVISFGLSIPLPIFNRVSADGTSTLSGTIQAGFHSIWQKIQTMLQLVLSLQGILAIIKALYFDSGKSTKHLLKRTLSKTELDQEDL
jgi:hypothetical protein